MPLPGLLWSLCEGVSSMLYDIQLVMSAPDPPYFFFFFNRPLPLLWQDWNGWVWKSTMSSALWHTASFRLPFNYTQEHLQWVPSAYCALSTGSLQPITQCLLSALCMTNTCTHTWSWCFLLSEREHMSAFELYFDHKPRMTGCSYL